MILFKNLLRLFISAVLGIAVCLIDVGVYTVLLISLTIFWILAGISRKFIVPTYGKYLKSKTGYNVTVTDKAYWLRFFVHCFGFAIAMFLHMLRII